MGILKRNLDNALTVSGELIGDPAVRAGVRARHRRGRALRRHLLRDHRDAPASARPGTRRPSRRGGTRRSRAGEPLRLRRVSGAAGPVRSTASSTSATTAIYIAEVVDVNDPHEARPRPRSSPDQFADTDRPAHLGERRAAPPPATRRACSSRPRRATRSSSAYVAGDVREPMIARLRRTRRERARPAAWSGPKKHGIVTAVGSVAFDEENGTNHGHLRRPQVDVTLDKAASSSCSTSPVRSAVDVTLDYDSQSKVTIDSRRDHAQGAPRSRSRRTHHHRDAQTAGQGDRQGRAAP